MENKTHEVGGYVSHSHIYVVPNKIDGDVVRTQSNKKWKEQQHTTTIHHHAHEGSCTGYYHESVPKVNNQSV